MSSRHPGPDEERARQRGHRTLRGWDSRASMDQAGRRSEWVTGNGVKGGEWVIEVRWGTEPNSCGGCTPRCQFLSYLIMICVPLILVETALQALIWQDAAKVSAFAWHTFRQDWHHHPVWLWWAHRSWRYGSETLLAQEPQGSVHGRLSFRAHVFGETFHIALY